MPQIHDVLIIGAGLSGLKAARDLQAAGRSALVLDKGRGVGGRAATRRWDGAPVDHGAQFFTARSEEFRAQTADWLARGVCFEWSRSFHQYDDGALRAPSADEAKHPRYACRAGMSALGKDLAAGLNVQTAARVIRLSRERDDSWQIETEEGGAVFAGRHVILAMPVPQTLALLRDSHLLDAVNADARRELEAVEVSPAIAVLLRGPAPAPEWRGIQLRDETLSWLSDDTSKRAAADGGAAADQRVFVLHGGGDFSRHWQDLDLEQAADRMTARAGEIVGDWIARLPERQVHRWRYAHVPRGVESRAYHCLLADDPTLYACGDAFLGSKVEGAYCSGQRLARDLAAETAR